MQEIYASVNTQLKCYLLGEPLQENQMQLLTLSECSHGTL